MRAKAAASDGAAELPPPPPRARECLGYEAQARDELTGREAEEK